MTVVHHGREKIIQHLDFWAEKSDSPKSKSMAKRIQITLCLAA